MILRGIKLFIMIILSSTIYGQTWFDEPYLIALIASGDLVPPTEFHNRVESEVAQILEIYPAMESFSMLPGWWPGGMVIRLSDAAGELIQNDGYYALDSLNALYGPVEVEIHEFSIGFFLTLNFETIYNPFLLSNIYESSWGVVFAEPNFSGDWHQKELVYHDSLRSIYNYEYRWGDCIAGCGLSHSWYFSFTNGVLDSMYNEGDPLFRVGFTQDTTEGSHPLIVQFTDWTLFGSGIDSVISWAWDFEDDGINDSYEQHPIHAYNEIGEYSVALVVESNGTVGEERKTDLIRVVETMSVSSDPNLFTHRLRVVSPNPFNSYLNIEYDLMHQTDLSVTIYDILGKKVWQQNIPAHPSGSHMLQWDARNNQGIDVVSGIYVICLSSTSWADFNKVTVLK
ncbi:MAG: T9SS type A sorting domain-containing protein [Candidatus Marinimicrobia bacterium]|jgi:PKD repeat protein|nr:T9SS type A sorting domain-containing protein [Candidatus Neomarinimicrobiota bacterium]MBT4254024.1 T9SS type A sorting domain-containing protein [Candidatus Neomarinimicrobiota bacterium]MBT4480996.1 T9SS type A sorting domain-containing protein [Candidatus Neomarinimicrobiota bacterium]MBT5234627.1 T9SS type A sorting domain-containing protein [Candidatus Neomarinimicrobiota bacterium]MBT5785016.1 T9SS type A sorting domain-containing protein [Candidatus Neomarinimicrobiota bacterium]